MPKEEKVVKYPYMEYNGQILYFVPYGDGGVVINSKNQPVGYIPDIRTITNLLVTPTKSK